MVVRVAQVSTDGGGGGAISYSHHEAGSSTSSGYSVNYASANAAVTSTETHVEDLGTVASDITEAFTSAEGALPPELTGALALLKLQREDHHDAVTKAKTFAEACISSAHTCLAEYNGATADQVAQTYHYMSKFDFDHPGLFGQTERIGSEAFANNRHVKDATSSANEGLPSVNERRTIDKEYSSERTGSGTTTTSSSSESHRGYGSHNAYGSSTSSTTSTTNGQYTTETTSSDWRRVGSTTRTTTDYTGHAHNLSDGGNERDASGSTTKTTNSSGTTTDREQGDMNLPAGAP